MDYILKYLNMSNTKDGFKIGDYDWVGFDLDNTLVRYDPKYIIDAAYEGTTRCLIESKKYPSHIFPPLEQSGLVDFVRKGVVVDCKAGNLLTIDADGFVIKATHGTRTLSDEEIIQIDDFPRLMTTFVQNPLQLVFSPSKKVFLDFNTAPIPLIYALLIDHVERDANTPSTPLSIWKDVMDAYEEFMSPGSELLHNRYSNPERYIYPWGQNVLNWLKQLKARKKVFLVSNSPPDWVSTAARVAMGENWKEYFDLTICSAMKPLFFMRKAQFLTEDSEAVELIELNKFYNQGCWEILYKNLVRLGGTKAVYIGDNIILDVYSGNKFKELDKVAIIEELGSEGKYASASRHGYSDYLKSNLWGSFLGDQFDTVWGDIVRKYSKLCIPSLDDLAAIGINSSCKPLWNLD